MSWQISPRYSTALGMVENLTSTFDPLIDTANAMPMTFRPETLKRKNFMFSNQKNG
jgi:hypothetical protein